MKTILPLIGMFFLIGHNFAQHIFPKNGPVGINTLQPRVTLDVNGITYSNSLIIGSLPINQTGFFHLHYTGSSLDTALLLISNKERRLFQVSNNGTVRTREVLVNLKNDWPDYVFSSSYQLRPLSELEHYINENNHLPGIPMASEVSENGVNLGEMNRLLLEKVEELTLYLIEQEKRIQLLEKQLNELK